MPKRYSKILKASQKEFYFFMSKHLDIVKKACEFYYSNHWQRTRNFEITEMYLKNYDCSNVQIGAIFGLSGTRAKQIFFDVSKKTKDYIRCLAEQNHTKNGYQDLIALAKIKHLFSVRTYRCLKNANIKTLSALKQCPDNKLLNIERFGLKSLQEVHFIISKLE